MALVVAPAVGFDSFVSREDADAYFAGQSYAAWAAATTDDRDNALRVGTVYVNAKRLIPSATYPTVHPNVERATEEAAKLALAGTLYKNGQTQAVIEKTVGPLTIRYANPAQGAVLNSIPYIDDLLAGLTYGGWGPVFFERV